MFHNISFREDYWKIQMKIVDKVNRLKLNKRIKNLSFYHNPINSFWIYQQQNKL